jgi:hypothetical protein
MTIEEIRTACAEACGLGERVKLEAKWSDGTVPFTSSIPNYPTDLNAAFTLCDVLKKEGIHFMFHNTNGHWFVAIDKDGCYMDYLTSHTTNPSLALAICETFLKVKGLWK